MEGSNDLDDVVSNRWNGITGESSSLLLLLLDRRALLFLDVGSTDDADDSISIIFVGYDVVAMIVYQIRGFF